MIKTNIFSLFYYYLKSAFRIALLELLINHKIVLIVIILVTNEKDKNSLIVFLVNKITSFMNL
jgi:hypothetical protein